MKGIYIIAIAFLASWAVTTANENFDQDESEESISTENVYADDIPTVCPVIEENPHNTTTNIPHETNCTKFYKCDVGKPIEQNCPLMKSPKNDTRLHYNRHRQVCDWPRLAGCSMCPDKDETDRYPSPDFIKDETNCREYYLCENGKKIRQTPCPVNTCFSRTCQRCVEHSEGGYCGPPISTSTTTTEPTTPKPKCKLGDVRHHKCDGAKEVNCAKYNVCEKRGDQIDWSEAIECPYGLHFSLIEKKCMSADEAGCFNPEK